jgi:hypothetical protein
MKALIDGDILRYELGYAAQTAWTAITEGRETIPPWELVESMTEERLADIIDKSGATDYQLYLTEGDTFRYELAKTQPYKASRKAEAKPWHWTNLSAYFKGVLGAEVVTYIEADDRLAIEHVKDPDTVICSRDKDLRQVPGWFYSWEIGRQPSFGPVEIDKVGSIELSPDRKKINGTGLSFFYSQVLTGDVADTIPGLPGCGPVKAFEALNECITINDMAWTVNQMYYNHYKNTDHDSEDILLEQGRLCWMTRRLHEDGTPVLWEIGMEE